MNTYEAAIETHDSSIIDGHTEHNLRAAQSRQEEVLHMVECSLQTVPLQGINTSPIGVTNDSLQIPLSWHRYISRSRGRELAGTTMGKLGSPRGCIVTKCKSPEQG